MDISLKEYITNENLNTLAFLVTAGATCCIASKAGKYLQVEDKKKKRIGDGNLIQNSTITISTKNKEIKNVR